jgi:hypothetical protein
MSYKSRHEIIDEALCSVFDDAGFEGEQANPGELAEEYLSEPIDVFIFYPKPREGFIRAFEFP